MWELYQLQLEAAVKSCKSISMSGKTLTEYFPRAHKNKCTAGSCLSTCWQTAAKNLRWKKHLKKYMYLYIYTRMYIHMQYIVNIKEKSRRARTFCCARCEMRYSKQAAIKGLCCVSIHFLVPSFALMTVGGGRGCAAANKGNSRCRQAKCDWAVFSWSWNFLHFAEFKLKLNFSNWRSLNVCMCLLPFFVVCGALYNQSVMNMLMKIKSNQIQSIFKWAANWGVQCNKLHQNCVTQLVE